MAGKITLKECLQLKNLEPLSADFFNHNILSIYSSETAAMIYLLLNYAAICSQSSFFCQASKNRIFFI